MENHEIVKIVLATAKENNGEIQLLCHQALKIADDCGVEPGEIGRICDENSIKLRGCQLGCF